MIAYITVWIKDIIFVVLFSSFLELLLPNSSMQRFVRVIMGLFILLAILNPIITFIERQSTVEQLPAMATGVESSHVQNTVNNVAAKREQLAYELYVRDLSKQIKATVMSIDGVANTKVIVTLDPTPPESKRIGKIKNVLIYIDPGATNNERQIAKVSIGIPKTIEQSKLLSSALADKIKRTVTELYQLKPNQVEVMRMN